MVDGQQHALLISIHAPREGGDIWTRIIVIGREISIHAPREGGDPVRLDELQVVDISIHAPREGGDGSVSGRGQARWYFNPRPPRGGRHINDLNFDSDIYDFNPRPPRGGRLAGRADEPPEPRFQSTPPARGATAGAAGGPALVVISIHAPREGGDKTLPVLRRRSNT